MTKTGAMARPIVKTLCFLLLALTSPAWADTYQKVGAGLVNGEGAISCWLVDSHALGRGIVVKISGVGKEGEANVLLSRDQLKELKSLCKKALSYRETLKDGQIEILGSFPSYENRLEVVVLRSNGVNVRCLVAHEKGVEQGFIMESFQEASLNRLFDDAMAALR